MEDFNTVAADCLVISCCCQCLILQIFIIILLKLPYKLFRKAKDIAKKLRRRKKRGKKTLLIVQTRRKRSFIHGSSTSPFRSPQGSFSSNDKFDESCMDEVEKVLEEFCLRGEFGFGRFWDGEEQVSSPCGSFPTCLGHDHHLHHQELDYDVVSFRLIQMFGSCNGTDQCLLL